MKRHSAMVQAGVFVAVTAVLITAVGLLFTNIRFGDTQEYTAIFTDSSGLKTGDEVRAAGVDVGRVKSVDLQPDGLVKIRFSVEPQVAPSKVTTARIRYADLVGGRYLGLANPQPGSEPLPAGATIPADRTTPALDLDQLFNGFAPLLQGLDPDEINTLTATLINTFEGETGDVTQLLATVARLTNGLADRDEVIGNLLVNLDTVLTSVDRNKEAFEATLVNTERVMKVLNKQRKTISNALVSLDSFTKSSDKFLASNRSPLKGAVTELGRVGEALNSELDMVDHYLTIFPESLKALGRAGAYGAFYNMYICGITFTTGVAGAEVRGPLIYANDNARCQWRDKPDTAVSTR